MPGTELVAALKNATQSATQHAVDFTTSVYCELIRWRFGF